MEFDEDPSSACLHDSGGLNSGPRPVSRSMEPMTSPRQAATETRRRHAGLPCVLRIFARLPGIAANPAPWQEVDRFH